MHMPYAHLQTRTKGLRLQGVVGPGCLKSTNVVGGSGERLFALGAKAKVFCDPYQV